MKPIEINPLAATGPVRSDLANARQAKAGNEGAVRSASGQSMVVRSEATSAGSAAPVDSERVNAIRSAIKEGRYPLVPTQIADAIIAAGYLLSERPENK